MAYYKRPNNYDSDVPLPQTEAKMSGRPQARPAEVVETPVTTTTSNGTAEYMSLLNQMKAAQEAEYARQREAYERQQAQLKAQQLNLRDQRNAQINEAFDNSKANLDSAKNSSMKDSYVAYMKGLKTMPQTSALSGNGGYAQSLLNRQQLNYENNRSNIEQNYLNNLRQLEENKNASLASSEESYLNGIMGLETNAQNYLNQLTALDDDTATYAAQMSALIDKATPAKQTTTGEYKYKVGNRTMSRSELLDYLAGLGYTTEEAKAYMEKYKLGV